jgi:flagellar basal-body rod protein FlgB
MNLSGIGTIRAAMQAMNTSSARMQVLSENVANANTPGYRAKDVMPFEGKVRSARAHGLVTTDHRHIKSKGAAGGGDIVVRDMKGSWGESPDGNNVSVEQQTIMISETSGSHQFAATMYKKSVDLLKMSISGRR